jgi:hypothetical protein
MPNFCPTPNANLVDLPAFSVADLMLPNSQAWNLHLLHDLFDATTVQNILSIHLPYYPEFNKWCWVPSCLGIFFVKSAHKLSLSEGGISSPLSTDAWFSLWGLKLQARLKHLLWKVAWDILPSRAKIGRFVVSDDPEAWSCPFCKGPLETLSHIFLECHLAKFLWRCSPCPFSILAFSTRPISDWVLAILSPMAALGIPKLEVRKFQHFAVLTLDFIWRARNQLVHEGIQPFSSKAIIQISLNLNHHISAWRDLTLPSLWTPLIVGYFKPNFYVATRGSFVVVAVVIINDMGIVLVAATHKLSSIEVL